jgi:hypothetical protein
MPAIIRQDLAISMVVIADLILATFKRWDGMNTGTIFSESSTMAVVARSLRLLGYRGATQADLVERVHLLGQRGSPACRIS